MTGRLVLLFLPDPVTALREASARARPGGLLCMHEADLAYLWRLGRGRQSLASVIGKTEPALQPLGRQPPGSG